MLLDSDAGKGAQAALGPLGALPAVLSPEQSVHLPSPEPKLQLVLLWGSKKRILERRKGACRTVMSPTCPVISSPTGKSELQTQIVPDLDTPKRAIGIQIVS